MVRSNSRPASSTRPSKHQPAAQDFRGWPEGSFIGQLPETDRAALLAAGTPFRFEDDEVLLVQGDVGDFVYVLTSGFAKHSVAADTGVETMIAVRSRGDLAGEFAVLDGGPHIATTRATGPVTALQVPAGAFTTIISESAAAQETVTRYIVTQTRAKYMQRAAERTWSPRERLAQVLYDLAATHGEPGPDGMVSLPFGQSELGELAGVAASTTERVLQELRREGVVSARYREILIKDMTHLGRTPISIRNPALPSFPDLSSRKRKQKGWVVRAAEEGRGAGSRRCGSPRGHLVGCGWWPGSSRTWAWRLCEVRWLLAGQGSAMSSARYPWLLAWLRPLIVRDAPPLVNGCCASFSAGKRRRRKKTALRACHRLAEPLRPLGQEHQRAGQEAAPANAGAARPAEEGTPGRLLRLGQRKRGGPSGIVGRTGRLRTVMEW